MLAEVQASGRFQAPGRRGAGQRRARLDDGPVLCRAPKSTTGPNGVPLYARHWLVFRATRRAGNGSELLGAAEFPNPGHERPFTGSASLVARCDPKPVVRESNWSFHGNQIAQAGVLAPEGLETFGPLMAPEQLETQFEPGAGYQL